MENIIKRISETRKKILRTIWESEKPITKRELSVKMGLKPRAIHMHLLSLEKEDFVKVSEEGYLLTEEGKNIIGFPKIDREKAKEILRTIAPENVFQFYADIDRPLRIQADSLLDLIEKIRLMDSRSLEFHIVRGDFKSWVHFLGDIELEKRLDLIQELSLSGDELRENLIQILKARYDELVIISSSE